jgi:hypothetical protein
MTGLDDETLLAWMTSDDYQGFLQCDSTFVLANDAIVAVAATDPANLVTALTQAYARWSCTVDALRLRHLGPQTRWQRYADSSTAALIVGALARIGDEEPFEFNLPAVRGSLGLHAMQVTNSPEKLAEFMADPGCPLTHDLSEAHAALSALHAVRAGDACPIFEPDGSWWAWYALYEPAARAAGQTAAAAWQIARSHQVGP